MIIIIIFYFMMFFTCALDNTLFLFLSNYTIVFRTISQLRKFQILLNHFDSKAPNYDSLECLEK